MPENKYYEGRSDTGDFQEALSNAIAAAMQDLKTDLVSRAIQEVSAQRGCFVNVNHITVVIHAPVG